MLCWASGGRDLQGLVRAKVGTGVSAPQKAHLAQCNGAGGQADEAPLPAVGVLGQGELLRQGLDHMLDLHGVVLGHELPHQPGERGDRGLWGGCSQVTCAPERGGGSWN